MDRKLFAATGVATALGLLLACGDKTATPVSPSTVRAVTSADADAADGATLKIAPPVLVSPMDNERIKDRVPTMALTNGQPKYAAAAVSYQFQLRDEANTLLEEIVLPAEAGGTTTWTATIKLGIDKIYRWRARATLMGQNGPWSAEGFFLSPKTLEAYIRGNELYDPLNTGAPSPLASFGSRLGGPGVEWIPEVGVELLDRGSFVQWILQMPLLEGEFSLEATNIEGDHSWKSKIMSMEDATGGNTTDNPFRVTVDKRPDSWADQCGRVRFTMRSDNPLNEEAAEPKGGCQSWDDNAWYGWRFTWRAGIADLWVTENGFDGPVKEHLTAEYDVPYAAIQHLIRLGSPFGRNEMETLSGVIIRHVWVSPNPRPTDLGK